MGEILKGHFTGYVTEQTLICIVNWCVNCVCVIVYTHHFEEGSQQSFGGEPLVMLKTKRLSDKTQSSIFPQRALQTARESAGQRPS